MHIYIYLQLVSEQLLLHWILYNPQNANCQLSKHIYTYYVFLYIHIAFIITIRNTRRSSTRLLPFSYNNINSSIPIFLSFFFLFYSNTIIHRYIYSTLCKYTLLVYIKYCRVIQLYKIRSLNTWMLCYFRAYS